jgi:hypothetical protein
MNWKQFLKPDCKKIVIFAIFLIITFIPFFCPFTSIVSSVITDISAWDLTCYSYIKLFYGSEQREPVQGFGNEPISMFFTIINLPPLIFAIFVNDFVGTIVWIIYWYVISCFIVWVYDKVKKKK